MKSIEEIVARLKGVKGRPWEYNPKHEMFVGTTHAIESYEHGTLDLGRASKGWTAKVNEVGLTSYVQTEDSKRDAERVKALGEFLQNCREDITFLLDRIRELEGKSTRYTSEEAKCENPEGRRFCIFVNSMGDHCKRCMWTKDHQ